MVKVVYMSKLELLSYQLINGDNFEHIAGRKTEPMDGVTLGLVEITFTCFLSPFLQLELKQYIGSIIAKFLSYLMNTPFFFAQTWPISP